MNFSESLVLIVDDDHTNRIVTEYTLGRHFKVMSCESGNSALDAISNGSVSVLIADQKMPGMTGIDLAEKCIHINPDIVRILITAYSDLPMAIEAINRGHVNHFIKKPWISEELISVVRQSIQRYHDSILLKKLQEEQIRMDRIRSLGVISSGIAHDIRQPITYITHFLHSINRDIKKAISKNKDDDVDNFLKVIETDIEDISRGVDVLSTLSENLLNQVNNLPLKFEHFSLKKVVDNVLLISKYTIRERANLLVDIPDANFTMFSCKTRVSQIILNLLLNASHSFSNHSDENTINLNIAYDEETVSIEVRDNGCGIKESIRRKIFEPLFSTRRYNGTGLGLSICRENVKDLGGKINVDTNAGEGTSFVIELPMSYDTRLLKGDCNVK